MLRILVKAIIDKTNELGRPPKIGRQSRRGAVYYLSEYLKRRHVLVVDDSVGDFYGRDPERPDVGFVIVAFALLNDFGSHPAR